MLFLELSFMKRCTAEAMDGTEKKSFTFDVDDQSLPPKRGELSNFQPPEFGRLYGDAYVAWVNLRANIGMAVATSVKIVGVEELQ